MIDLKASVVREQPRSGTTSTRHRNDQKKHPHQTFSQVIQTNPVVNLVVPLVLFVALCVAGGSVVTTHRVHAREESRRQAQTLAHETGAWFAQQLDQALLPLFSLQQFVYDISEWQSLPAHIGAVGEPGSLPMAPPAVNNNASSSSVRTHRSLQNSPCTDPDMVQRFATIAHRIHESANMPGVLVNLQLAPHAVVCWIHPLHYTYNDMSGGDDNPSNNNTVVYMDSSAALGHDLLQDPARRYIAVSTLQRPGRVHIAGPLKLLQCQQNSNSFSSSSDSQTTCDPAIMEQGLIARLSIPSRDRHVIRVNNDDDEEEGYARWGFAVAIINWQALLDRSRLYETFAARDLTFSLTRTDHIVGPRGEMVEHVEVVAEGAHWDTTTTSTAGWKLVTVPLETTDNEWEMTVGYHDPNDLPHLVAALLVVLVSAFLSALIFTVLAQQQINAELQKEEGDLLVENARAATQAERDLNEYISHEIRNPLAAAIAATSFVGTAVEDCTSAANKNKKKELDVKSTKEDLAIVNHSLNYIDELLRTMLDIHRTESHHLKLHKRPLSIKHDVFLPVTSMLHQRSSNGASKFCVVVDCPDDLYVCADRLRLQQITLNLARNATQFVTQGKEGIVRLRANVSSGCVCLCVEDTGPGISPAQRARLFERYQESLDSCHQGTGMGLYLCKQLVDLMGGDIYLDEDYDAYVATGIPDCGPGTRFIINLHTPPAPLDEIKETQPLHRSTTPAIWMDGMSQVSDDSHTNTTTESSLASEEAITRETHQGTNEGSRTPECTLDTKSQDNLQQKSKQQKEVASADTPLPKNWSILFVDDDKTLRKLSKRCLQKVAPTWKMDEASSGEMALAMMMDQEKHFDLIFMDEYMSTAGQSLKGTETTRRLRAKGYTKPLICGLSANNLAPDFLKCGANDFWLKPFPCRPDELRQHLLHLKAMKEQEEQGSGLKEDEQ
mmetsp:Transcript_1931/g.3698  ORF Transcript_1931/g.3698 Transcript_1931/m.3698 type:complete len:950 (-) Transcript_1931:171-3020(-)